MCYLDEDSEHGDLYKCIGVLVTETRTVYRWKKLAGQEEVERLEKAIGELDVQPDWNQNDETAKDYVKGRTHYTERKAIESAINPPQTELKGLYFAVGDTVTVTVDGVKHSLVAVNNDGMVMVGESPAVVMGGTGELGWGIITNGTDAIIITKESHSISYECDVIHELDAKYIPILPTDKVNNANNFCVDLSNLIGSWSLGETLSNGVTVIQVKNAEVDFTVLKTLGLFEKDGIGIYKRGSVTSTFASFSCYIISGKESPVIKFYNYVLVHKSNAEQGIADYKEAFGIT